jgi:hypothetical protein
MNEIKRKYITTENVVEERVYQIEVLKRNLFGKLKWKPFKAIDYSYAGDYDYKAVIFSDFDEAKEYLNKLRCFYND